MNFKNKTIMEINELIMKEQISVSNIIDETIKSSINQSKSNYLVTECYEEAKNIANKLDKVKKSNLNPLFGIPYVLKDCISTKGILTTGCSKILSNYIPPYNATIYNSLNNLEAIMIGKSTLDELCLGGTGLTAFNGIVPNPYDDTRIAGGSSTGSVYAVAKGIVPFAIGTDTGDSIRKPASYCGVVGYKPSYGSISRYGVFPYAPSLDHVGFITNNVEDCAILADCLFEKDINDMTSIENKNEYYKKLKIKNKFNFGYLREWYNELDEQQKKYYDNLFSHLRSQGSNVKELSLDKELIDNLISLYRIISFSEVSSSQANLDGIKFGIRENGESFDKVISNSRMKGIGKNVKRRYVIGEYILDSENQIEFLEKAKKVRRKITNKINEIFNSVDTLICSGNSDIAPLIKDLLNKDESNITKSIDDLLLLGNFSGIPSISIPFVKKQNMPIGLCLNSNYKNDLLLLQSAQLIEKIINDNFKGENYE